MVLQLSTKAYGTLQSVLKKILSKALNGKVSVSNFNYNFNENK